MKRFLTHYFTKTLIISVFIFNGFTFYSNAATYYVKPTGNDANSGTSIANAWATLEMAKDPTAVAALAAGDIIYFAPGTYAGSTLSCAYAGTSGNTIQYIADVTGAVFGVAPGAVNVTIPDVASNYGFLISAKSYIVIDGFTIYGDASPAGRDGIRISGNSDYNEVKNCNISTYNDTYAGVQILNSTTNLPEFNMIHNNIINDAGGIGVKLLGTTIANACNSNKIYNNTITANNGVYLTYCASTEIYNNTINGKLLTGGIKMDNAVSSSKIYNNMIYTDGACTTSSYCIVLSLNTAGGTTTQNNKIYHNSMYSSGDCMRFNNGTDNTGNELINNILYTASATTTNYCINMAVATTIQFSKCNYNQFYLPSGAKAGYFNSTAYATFANWQALDHSSEGALNGDENSLQGDPLYVSTTNLHITNSASPCKATATAITTAAFGFDITTDIDGNARSALHTIGADHIVTSLPIELLFFKGKKQGKYNELRWATASELNNDFFTVEKTLDGINFEIVRLENGAGNSIQYLSYQLVDYEVRNVINYYRLKQTDFDGKFEYSELISIDNSTDEVSKEITLITNILGQEVNKYYRGLVVIIFSDGTSIKMVQ